MNQCGVEAQRRVSPNYRATAIVPLQVRQTSASFFTMGSNKPRGLQAARKLRNDRRENRWVSLHL